MLVALGQSSRACSFVKGVLSLPNPASLTNVGTMQTPVGEDGKFGLEVVVPKTVEACAVGPAARYTGIELVRMAQTNNMIMHIRQH